MNSRASSLGSSIVTSIFRVSAVRFPSQQSAKGLTRGVHLYTRNSLFPPSTQPAKDTDKMSQTNLPLQGIFPIEKPTGPTSMKVLDMITPLLTNSKLFDDPDKLQFNNNQNKRKRNQTDKGLKIGQGGTLDPLADGVLVVGVNRGTKHLQAYLEGTKEYESIGILGAATNTMDAEGAVITTGNFDGITREDVEAALQKFQGQITQTPPIFSALKMDGKPLYEYARENKPLPRAIPSRQVKVSVELLEFTPAQKEDGDGGHSYKWPEERLSPEERDVFRRLTELVDQTKDKTASTATTTPAPKIGDMHWHELSEKTGLRPPTFKIRMTVSGGTYVRSIVNDVGELLGCGAHVVLLRRTRQGRFALHGDGSSISEEEKKIYDEMVQKTAKDTELSDEEAMMSGPASSTKVVTGGGTEDKPLTSEETEAQTKTHQSTTGCIPWSVFERAIAEHKEMLAEEEREKEELIASGMPKAEAMKLFTWEAKHAKRIDRPLKEWEYETLRRFVSVYVPKTGEHNSGMAKRNSYARGGGGGGGGGRRY